MDFYRLVSGDYTNAQIAALYYPRRVTIKKTQTNLWLVTITALVIASLSALGCQSGVNLSPLQHASDQAAILLTEYGKNHAKLIEQQTRDKWLFCNTITNENEKITCRVNAVDAVFSANKDVTIALQDAKNLQHVIAATLETATVCVATSNERQKCESEAWQKALEIYPKLRALMLRLQQEKANKK